MRFVIRSSKLLGFGNTNPAGLTFVPFEPDAIKLFALISPLALILPDAVMGWLNVIDSVTNTAAVVDELAKISTLPAVGDPESLSLPILIESALDVPKFNTPWGVIDIASDAPIVVIFWLPSNVKFPEAVIVFTTRSPLALILPDAVILHVGLKIQPIVG